MMDSVIIFERITIDPPCKKIYQRLGFRKKTTELTALRKKETDTFIEEALSLINLKGTMLKAVITGNNGAEVFLSANLTFVSKQLAGFLRDCREALLMGATAGSAIMDAIKDKTDKDNLSAAVVYDATASEMVDAALDWIMDYFNQQIRREGKKLLSRRFSAGYADFQLDNQQVIYQKLQMEKIGVAINNSFILKPEKSVTALGGICG
jgi:hypothetical protein